MLPGTPTVFPDRASICFSSGLVSSEQMSSRMAHHYIMQSKEVEKMGLGDA